MNGNKVTTWVYWHVAKNDQFHIHVQDSPEVTKDRMQVIADVILSNKTIVVGNETYYVGWSGALQAISHQNVKNIIPFHFHVMKTSPESGNIVIKLTNLENPDGYTGYTKIIASNSQHQILKSVITIYHMDKLNYPQLALIVRHELGHAFGLLHSDNPADLMYPNIQRNLPYVSKCDAQAIVNLYNGTGMNKITC
ncbi:MAG: matrixin family metalloprotease [Thaumarchaeota archaeon]|nr:matrixin family metalloprotease [Nitrososphaerota archaeon]